ncbi:DUF1989 domain-containing protein [Oleomonas cavernae]|nr:aminomethyltransferase family protein [Oleomonas cavernae]
MAVTLGAGDRLTIRDAEGLQPAGLVVLEGDLGPLPERLLTGATAPGSSVTLEAPTASTVVISAPGADMAPDEQAPPTDLVVEIARHGANARPLPPPLGRVKAELHIDAATASAYKVSAGDYIQVIDVDGKQCSDFLAFDAARLDDGEEIGIDATTTTTLLGAAYPGPGLLSKFFDGRMRPLVEVVRDTVGRHDTFALACTAKYYEDMGYPGHPSCSDNFNGALAPYGIAPRKGWPAINLFFNTAMGSDNRLSSDEPWSRPGDYVLFRAMTDLVCASSACPDDIDPSNAWMPTDIHVRIYDKAQEFSKGNAHRMTPDAIPRLTRTSGFHDRTSVLTRNLVDYRGFWTPDCYAGNGPIDEYWAARERCVVMDLSALRKFEVIGPDAEALLQKAQTRNLAKLAVGQVVYTAFCYEHGGMIDDGTIFRLGLQNFRVVCGDDYLGVWLRQLAEQHELKAWVKSSTDQLGNLAVQGPLSRTVLEQVIWTPPVQASITELKWFRFTIGRIGGPQGPAVVVSRTGYTGELGFEIWCHPKDGVAVWDAIWAAGKPHGLAPLGLSALDMLRVEAGLVFAGYDFDDQTDPFEAGIGFTVADKAEDYVGKTALARRRANPLRKLVGLEITGNEAIGHGDCLHIGRAQIGVVTSAARSPLLGRTIALARVDALYADLGRTVEIGKLDGQQKRIAARVVRFPHYDPEKTRVRA